MSNLPTAPVKLAGALADAHIGRDVLALEALAVGYDRPLLN